MIEPYLLAENDSSTRDQTPHHSWQNERKYSIPDRNDDTSQLNDCDDDVQIISWEVTAGSSRQTNIVDLSKSIFEFPNDNNYEFVNDVYFNKNGIGSASMAASTSRQSTIDTNSIGPIPMDNNVVDLFSNHRIPQTITSGQIAKDNSVALPDQFPQTLPQISIANFAKEENIGNNANDVNTFNGILDDVREMIPRNASPDAILGRKRRLGIISLDDVDWVNEADAVTHVNGLNIENNFNGDKQQNQSQITNNFFNINNSVINIDLNPTDNDTIVFGNGITEQLPETTVAAATAPGTSTLTSNDWEDIFNVINLPDLPDFAPNTHFEPNTNFEPNNQFEPNNTQPGPCISNFNWHFPNAGAVNNNAPTQDAANNKPNLNHQIHNNFAFFDKLPQLFPPVELLGQVPTALQPTAPTLLPLAPPTRIAHEKPPEALINQINNAYVVTSTINADTQQNQPGPSGTAIQIRQQMSDIERAPFEGAVPRWFHQLQDQQQQANAAPLLFPPYTANGMQPTRNNMAGQSVNYTPIGPNIPNAAPPTIRRKHSVTVKVVRNTKQYETLVEMGFDKKDIQTALRKFNLDLYETIEYLSEPKHAAKRRKKDLNPRNQFNSEIPNQIQKANEINNVYAVQQANEINKVYAEPKKPANLYEELLYLEEMGGIVKSVESFDCDICMETIEMKDGIILRNCLHRYCKDCLNGTIVHSDEIDIKCPYVSCAEMLQDREIRAVLLQDEYEKYLMKGVRVAQITISGTILCNLPDCNGWCICDDEINVFKCPQCKNINCIPCKAIHPDRNCREYQEDLAAGDANGAISGQMRSYQAIQELINTNEAMKCPKCGILIMKREGCDYITCAMCKTGICWATKGPRYGPGGRGDTSGGCGCSVLKRCHKDCRGCH